MANEKFTDLPTVASSQAADIICAVQGGVSVQETLQQVLNLGLASTVLHNAGNPNGSVAGVVYQLLWDTTDVILWVCTTSGNSATAVWTPVIGSLTNGQLRIGSSGTFPAAATLTPGAGISITNGAGSITIASSGGGITWNEITVVGPTTMAVQNGYIANNSGLVSLLLPVASPVGSVLSIVGKGSGGWRITQGSGQQIQIGMNASMSGAGGSVSSANQWDSVNLVCVTADTIWVTVGAPESAGLSIV